jgi:uroporphyrinogen decarboxylase
MGNPIACAHCPLFIAHFPFLLSFPPMTDIVRETRPAGYKHPFLEAALGRTPERSPVWIMRQAGRYLPDYRRVRKSFPSFLEFCRTPDAVAEVTVQPVDQIGVDAAILFSDILVLLPPMGLNLEFVEGEGPVVHNPVRDAATIAAMPGGNVGDDINTDLDYVFEGIRRTQANLQGYVPLIGFAGGPFTVASYMVEGGSSKELAKLKGLMYSDPASYHLLLSKLSNLTASYLIEQARQGANALTIMDSWAGYLGPRDYREFAQPYTQRIVKAVKAAYPEIPVIHYANGAPTLLNDFVGLGPNVVGLDWRVELQDAFKAHPNQVFQGNLDPSYLFAPPEKIVARVAEMKQVVGSRPHVWNLGHGIMPQTPVENAKAFVNAVHEG